jgi:hypothetical protein
MSEAKRPRPADQPRPSGNSAGRAEQARTKGAETRAKRAENRTTRAEQARTKGAETRTGQGERTRAKVAEARTRRVERARTERGESGPDRTGRTSEQRPGANPDRTGRTSEQRPGRNPDRPTDANRPAGDKAGRDVPRRGEPSIVDRVRDTLRRWMSRDDTPSRLDHPRAHRPERSDRAGGRRVMSFELYGRRVTMGQDPDRPPARTEQVDQRRSPAQAYDPREADSRLERNLANFDQTQEARSVAGKFEQASHAVSGPEARTDRPPTTGQGERTDQPSTTGPGAWTDGPPATRRGGPTDRPPTGQGGPTDQPTTGPGERTDHPRITDPNSPDHPYADGAFGVIAAFVAIVGAARIFREKLGQWGREGRDGDH